MHENQINRCRNIRSETDDSNTTVHFGMKFNPRLLLGATLKDLIEVLRQNLRVPNGVVDINSVVVREFLPSTAVTAPSFLPETSSTSSHVLEDNISNIAGRCVLCMQLPFCTNITEKSYTAYPNLLMHKSKEDVTDDLIIFRYVRVQLSHRRLVHNVKIPVFVISLISNLLYIRELIDGECYEYAAEFLCSVLQPKCIQRPGLPADETKLPCRAFCREFWAGCGDRLSDRLKKSLDCFKFPEYSDFGRKCKAQPSKLDLRFLIHYNAVLW